MKKLLIVLVMGVRVSTLCACATMKGLGKDVEDGGEWIQKKAN
jgi:predicted small secreted protein